MLSSRLSRRAVGPERSGEPALSEVEWGPAVSFSHKRIFTGSTAPSFVIPTGAKRSGGICGLFQPQTNLHWEHCPQLCHPDRSGAKWRDLLSLSAQTNLHWEHRPQLCHPDRSGAKSNGDLQFTLPATGRL